MKEAQDAVLTAKQPPGRRMVCENQADSGSGLMIANKFEQMHGLVFQERTLEQTSE